MLLPSQRLCWSNVFWEHEKNPERVIAGLKASIHNSAVSEEAKNHAKERLREMGVDPNDSASVSTGESAQASSSSRGSES